MTKTETKHGKFYFVKYDLMENARLIQENGWTTNGIIMLKDEYVGLRKNFEFNTITLSEFTGCKATLKDRFNYIMSYVDGVKYVYDNEAKMTFNKISLKAEDAEKYVPKTADKKMYERLMKISKNIEFYSLPMQPYTPVQIVLNGQVIGIFCDQC